jgi:hypothetical protein
MWAGALACVLFDNTSKRRSAAGLLTRDEARRTAVNVAELPELLRSVMPYPARFAL